MKKAPWVSLLICALLAQGVRAATRTVRFIKESGTQPVHVFIRGGAEVIVPCTRQEYDALAHGGTPTPPRAGDVWKRSELRRTYSDEANVPVSPRKDDAIIHPSGDAILFKDGDIYRGAVESLAKEEYAPTRTGPTTLTTSKAIPASAAAQVEKK